MKLARDRRSSTEEAASPRTEVSSAPVSGTQAPRFAIPEREAMRKLRQALARGGASQADMDVPERGARTTAFYVMVDLLRLLDEFQRRVTSGERCRLAFVKRSHLPGRLSIDIAIEPQQ